MTDRRPRIFARTLNIGFSFHLIFPNNETTLFVLFCHRHIVLLSTDRTSDFPHSNIDVAHCSVFGIYETLNPWWMRPISLLLPRSKQSRESRKIKQRSDMQSISSWIERLCFLCNTNHSIYIRNRFDCYRHMLNGILPTSSSLDKISLPLFVG